MMTTRMMTESAEVLDADLVSQSLAGDRDAFGRIVSRYQSLICSLAYSATGSLGQSEDLAQETFITAWKHLSHLREQHKLRPWLCGIARNRINNWLRREGHEPSHHAESLDTAEDAPALEPLPHDLTISKEEESILWRSLERIPEHYREPLVLFYREQQSVQRVAEALELSEDAVKQRLSRGRKLLQEQVLAFVEGALTRTNPGKAFTLGVMAALPAFTLSAKAAVLGATAKGATAKTAGAMGLTGALLSVAMVVFGNYIGYRMSVDCASSERERKFVKSFYRRLFGCMVGFGVAIALVLSLPKHYVGSNWFFGVIIGLAAGYLIITIALGTWCFRRRQKLIAELAADGPVAEAPAWEYRSNASLLGVPFVHIRVGGGLLAQRKPVKAWMAAGDTAIGLLAAFGGIAIAPISIGGCAIGLLPFGGFAVGALAVGGLSVGIWSFGGLALGWQALGGCAIGWSAAFGGTAIAHDYALGGIAQAVQVNNDIANQAIRSNPFFIYGEAALRYFVWLNLLWLVPMLLWWRTVKRSRAARA